MANVIKLKRSSVPGKVPVANDLTVGELAVNTVDGVLYTKLTDGSVKRLGGSKFITASTQPTGQVAGDLWYNTSNDILYIYVVNGGSSFYLDISSVNTGYTGSQGAQGSQGATGYTGSQGTTGYVGSRGNSFTSGASAPSNPFFGDMWYYTPTDSLLRYMDVGSGSYWIDVTGPTLDVGESAADAAARIGTSVTAPSTVEYLVVAGGGGGGNDALGSGSGGGGGAGGFRTGSGYSVTSGTPIAVTVGGGGGSFTAGSNSVFGIIISNGGGRGGRYDGSAGGAIGGNGGSGGGGGIYVGPLTQPGGSGNTPVTTPSQGNNGGTSAHVSGVNGAGGGGGGASAVGATATLSPNAGGNGGAGTASSISGSSVIYAGGGGGALNVGPGTGGTGGSGGGGNGAYPSNNPTNGTANTGGGGGGASQGTTVGSGGSGIVIIRYADTFAAATSTTGTPTITTGGGYRVYQWTNSGSITF